MTQAWAAIRAAYVVQPWKMSVYDDTGEALLQLGWYVCTALLESSASGLCPRETALVLLFLR